MRAVYYNSFNGLTRLSIETKEREIEFILIYSYFLKLMYSKNRRVLNLKYIAHPNKNKPQ